MVITRASGSFVFVFLRVLTWGFLDTVLGEASCSTEEAWSLFVISWVLRPATDQVVNLSVTDLSVAGEPTDLSVAGEPTNLRWLG